MTITAASLAMALGATALLLSGLIVWAYLRDRAQERRARHRGTATPPDGDHTVDREDRSP